MHFLLSESQKEWHSWFAGWGRDSTRDNPMLRLFLSGISVVRQRSTTKDLLTAARSRHIFVKCSFCFLMFLEYKSLSGRIKPFRDEYDFLFRVSSRWFEKKSPNSRRIIQMNWIFLKSRFSRCQQFVVLRLFCRLVSSSIHNPKMNFYDSSAALCSVHNLKIKGNCRDATFIPPNRWKIPSGFPCYVPKQSLFCTHCKKIFEERIFCAEMTNVYFISHT